MRRVDSTLDVPLSTLLSWTWIAFAMEVDNAVEAGIHEHVGHLFAISLATWTNGLRCIDEDGVSVDDLRNRVHAACNVGGLERWGWITLGRKRGTKGYGTNAGLARATLRPTRAGVLARAAWPVAIAKVEDRWRERFGKPAIDGLRAAVRDALARIERPMPWSPPEIHPSDGFYTHVIGTQHVEEEVPLAGALGQLLTALTLGLERAAAVSLPLAANVLRVVGPQGVSVRDLPTLSGVSREAIAMAINFLQRRGFVERLPGPSVKLTPAGLDALDGYRARAGVLNDVQLRAALEAVVSQAEAFAVGLEPPAGSWRLEKPYVSQTRRLTVEPRTALPWQPMVLHRGGWPDGA